MTRTALRLIPWTAAVLSLVHPGAALAAPAATAPKAAAATAARRKLQWKLADFTWVRIVPSEDAIPNGHPVRLTKALLTDRLGSITLGADPDATTLFAKDELGWLAKPLVEAFETARPDEDILVLSTSRRGASFLEQPTAATVRLFVRDGALQCLVHDARLEFMDRYIGMHEVPNFVFGSRTRAGEVQLVSTAGASRRPDWLSLSLAAAPPATVAAPAVPSAAPAVAAPAPAAKPAPHDAAFYTDLEQRLQFLKRLRDQNLIGPEEFERKQRELLKDL
jgi:hypothetical protein